MKQFLYSYTISKIFYMGCCKPSSPLKITNERYNNNNLNEHCLRRFQLEYFMQEQKKLEQKMLQISKQIQESKIQQIQEKEKVVQTKFQKIINNARTEPEKVRQIEVRRNMTLEQIIGLEASRRKFIEIKNIVRKNVGKVNEEIEEDMRLRFQLIKSSLKQGLLKIQQTNQQADQIVDYYSNFVDSRKQEIDRSKKQVDQKIQKAFNFEKYSAKYHSVIPNQQLMTLTLNDNIKQSSIKSLRADQFQQTQETEGVTCNSCCCFPED